MHPTLTLQVTRVKCEFNWSRVIACLIHRYNHLIKYGNLSLIGYLVRWMYSKQPVQQVLGFLAWKMHGRVAYHLLCLQTFLFVFWQYNVSSNYWNSNGNEKCCFHCWFVLYRYKHSLIRLFNNNCKYLENCADTQDLYSGNNISWKFSIIYENETFPISRDYGSLMTETWWKKPAKRTKYKYE
jgi:hypothetical protein